MPRRFQVLAIFATVLSGVAVVWPLLAMPAFLIVLLAFIVTTGHLRWLVGGLGGTLAMIAFVRFLLATAVPNIVVAGQMAAEDNALDRLREIKWASLKLEQQDGGTKTDLSLPDLLGPYLDTRIYRPTTVPGVYRCDSYLVTLYPRAGGAFRAYAWPLGETQGGRRSFAIDDRDDICELDVAGAYIGEKQVPPGDAAFDAASGSPCHAPWHVWKNKKTRP